MLFIQGDMTMSKHNNAGIGKFLAGHMFAIIRIPQNMHYTDPAIPNHNLALDRQFQYHLI